MVKKTRDANHDNKVVTLKDLETFKDNFRVDVETMDSEQTQEGKVLVSDGKGGAKFTTPVASAMKYLTTAPKQANTSGNLIFVVLEAEPRRYYDGYYYIILESEEEEEEDDNNDEPML